VAIANRPSGEAAQSTEIDSAPSSRGAERREINLRMLHCDRFVVAVQHPET